MITCKEYCGHSFDTFEVLLHKCVYLGCPHKKKRTDIYALHERMTGHLFQAYSSTDERFLALALCSEAGELANIVKKRWRDGVDLSEEARDEIADVRIYLELLAKCFGIEGEKLDARVERKLAEVAEKHRDRLAKSPPVPESIIVPTPDGPRGYVVSGDGGIKNNDYIGAVKPAPQAEDFFVTQARRLGVTVEEVKYGEGVRRAPPAPAITGQAEVAPGTTAADLGVNAEPNYIEPWVLAVERADALLPVAVRDVLYVRWTKDFLVLEPALTGIEMWQVRRMTESYVTAKNCATLYDQASEYYVLRISECPPSDRPLWPTLPVEVSQVDHEALPPWQRGLYAKDWGSGRWGLRPEHQAWGGATT